MKNKERREQILNGELYFPQQILSLLNPNKSETFNEFLLSFWDSLWNNFLMESSTSSIYWIDKLGNEKQFNIILMHLSKSGWITNKIEKNFACIELNKEKLLKWITDEEILAIRKKYKMNKYRLGVKKSTLNNQVQINRMVKQTGLIREGFKRVGNFKFKYDTNYIKDFKEDIAKYLKKSLEASTKEITYQEIIDELTNYYSQYEGYYNLNNCRIDSRGRSIFQCSKKLLNPVSHKVARALLIYEPETLTKDGWDCVYAGIAELLGYRGKNYKDKVEYGVRMYIARTLPSLDDMRNKQNYDHLDEYILLSRIYENIDDYELIGWIVPISIDALASLIQITAVLLNNYEYMDKTNLVGEEFKDIWTTDYCSRIHVKKALTPKLYGSSKHPKVLWDKNKLEYTQQQLNKIDADLMIGVYSHANNFKNFVINEVKPKTKMTVHVWNDLFEIECNRFKWQETTQKEYWIYDSTTGKVKQIIQKVQLVPDLNQFKRFFQTLLLHGIDSQIANKICLEVDCIPNHDSFTLSPNNACKVRKIYTDCMYEIWTNRRKILFDYFVSIGITKSYPDGTHENEIKEFSPYCLK